MSAKRRAQNRQRRQVVAALVADDPWCQARLPKVCTGLAVDAHEVQTRARSGSVIDPENIRMLCRACHEFVTVNPAWADATGWTRPSWHARSRPEQQEARPEGGTGRASR